MEDKQVIEVLEAFGQQALANGLFKRFGDVSLWQQSLAALKNKIALAEQRQAENGKDDDSRASQQ